MSRSRRSTEYRNNSRVIDMDEARRQRQEKRQAEQARKEEKETRAKKRNTRGKRAIRRSKRRKSLIRIAVVVGILLVVFLLVVNIITLKKEQHDVLEEHDRLKEQKEELQQEIKDAGNAENVEDEARDQLRLVKPGETLYLFPDDVNDDGEKTQEDNDR